MCNRIAVKLFRRAPSVILLVTLLVLTPLLGACDISVGKQEVVVITATSQPQSQVVVVTATSEPQSQVIVVTATATQGVAVQQATPDVQATVAAALAATLAAQPSDTPVPPTDTAVPPTPDLPATLQAMMTLTQAAIPTNTPTNTPKPATNTPKPPTRTPTPASYPPPTLLNPPAEFNCYDQFGAGCDFSWSWGMALKTNEYFQVQLVGPSNAHRGIHPPTKGYSFHSSNDVYQIITDWCDPNKYCHIQWAVVVVEWDGVDPGKIGRTLAESAWRWIKL